MSWAASRSAWRNDSTASCRAQDLDSSRVKTGRPRTSPMAWTASGASPARFSLVRIQPMKLPHSEVQAPKNRVPVPLSSAP